MNSTPDSNRRQFLKQATILTGAITTAPYVSLGQENRKVTLAFAGCAHIHTPSFVELLRKRPDVRVKSVYDHDTARAEKRAKDLKAQVVEDPDKIWSDSEVEGVVICSETTRHKDLVLAGAKARKHMFVEKPLGITSKESIDMAKAIEKAGVLFTTGYFMRTDPKHIFLKEEVAKGNFGKITRVRGSNCHSGALGGWFDTEWRWMADPKLAGVGGFGDLGTHKLDILLWLFGDVDSVTAQVQTVTGRYENCDESGEGMLRFKNDIIGTLAAGWVDVDDPVQLLISGTEGHATIINNQLFYRSKKAGADSKAPYTNLPKAPAAPMDQFVNAVAGAKDQPLVTPAEAARRVTVMAAMYEAARKEKWVKVDAA